MWRCEHRGLAGRCSAPNVQIDNRDEILKVMEAIGKRGLKSAEGSAGMPKKSSMGAACDVLANETEGRFAWARYVVIVQGTLSRADYL